MVTAMGAVKRGTRARFAFGARQRRRLAMPGCSGYGRRAWRRRGTAPMCSLLQLISTVITIYIWLLIIQAVLSWLIAFGVVNTRNRAVIMIGDMMWRLTEPALRPIRRILPHLGGIDISPVILILLLWFVRNLMFEYLGPVACSGY
jgi:YggT family protein